MKNYFFKKNKKILEVDEIFFDCHQLTSRDLKWENRLERPIAPKNIQIIFSVIILGLLFFTARIFQLSLFRGAFYLERARANYVKELWSLAPRGIIYDSAGGILVKNVSSFNLVAIPAELPKDRPSQENLIKSLAYFLNKDENEIIEKFKKIDRFSSRPVLILEDLSHEEVLRFKSSLENVAGLSLEENFKRDYIKPKVFSHILGYTGRVSQSDLRKNPSYLLTDIMGKDGLENYYDEALRGKHGLTLIESEAGGKKNKIISQDKAESGKNLVLFLNEGLQEKLTQTLANELASRGLTRAAAVALDPRSGAILAMQSLPLFDNNNFSSRLSLEQYQAIFEDKNKPLFNRAVSGVYPPGSTMKPFVGLAALEEKIIDDKTTVHDTGSINVGEYEFVGWKPLGTVDIYKAIALSSNIFFYTLGGGYGNISGLGPIRIADYLKRFGFNVLSGIDLPLEAKGLIPDPDWKKKVKGESWFIGDTYHMSIGQGDVGVTPLQLALATAAIANKGVLLKPRLLKSITDSSGQIISSTQPEITRKNFVSQENLAIMRRAMQETVLAGSGKPLASLPGSAGGKTGTAEPGQGHSTHAWFTAFAPYENPEIVITVLVENSGEGAYVAVPITAEVLKWYFDKIKN